MIWRRQRRGNAKAGPPGAAPQKRRLPRRTHLAGKPSSLSFYLRDSAGLARLAPSVPVSGLLQSRIRPRSSRLRVSLRRQAFAVSPGISFAGIQLWYYLNTPRPGCQSCFFTKCPQSKDGYFFSVDKKKGRAAPLPRFSVTAPARRSRRRWNGSPVGGGPCPAPCGDAG